jgi:hypothetical protein
LREFRPCMPMNASAASPVSSVSLSRVGAHPLEGSQDPPGRVLDDPV